MANSSALRKESPQPSYAIRKILIAHDGSPAAAVALKDGVDMARKFGAEIVLARVEMPGEELSGTSYAPQQAENIADLEEIQQELTKQGLKSHIQVRTGHVGDTLFDLSHKEKSDMLMLGAYGMGRRDRHTLGSTAEHLLRAIPCPAMTYGPEAQAGLMERLKQNRPILLPIPMPCEHCDIDFAGQIAALLGGSLELLHVIEGPQLPRTRKKFETACRALVRSMEKQGVKTCCTVFFGVPEVFIHAVAVERQSPLILMPLKRRDRLSSITSDNVAAQIIRRAKVPVLSYRLD